MPELLRGSAASGNSVPGQSATFETETCVVFDLSVGWFCLKIVERSVEARKESSELCGEPAGVQLTHSRVAQAKAAATVCSGTAKHWLCDAGRQGFCSSCRFPLTVPCCVCKRPALQPRAGDSNNVAKAWTCPVPEKFRLFRNSATGEAWGQWLNPRTFQKAHEPAAAAGPM